jgi:hypothetical protein
MDGFGPLRRELDEPVFHELWATSAGRNESLLIDLWESYLRGIEAARSPAGELPLQKLRQRRHCYRAKSRVRRYKRVAGGAASCVSSGLC